MKINLSRTLALVSSVILLISSPIWSVHAGDQIRIVGSSTVFPFSALVSEWYTRKSGASAPVVESTGTGGGFKIFCSGVGGDTADIVNASREIKDSEKKACAASGVTPIKVIIGYDGITLGADRQVKQLSLNQGQIFRALAKQIPVNGKLVVNPNKTWQDVDGSLPDTPIRVYGPPPTSGTRDAFAELVLEAGAESDSYLAKIKNEDEKKFKAIAHALREDGAYIEAGENDSLIVQKLKADPDAMGIFGFSYFEQNSDQIVAMKINDIMPTFESIADGSYVVSRKLLFYVKREHFERTSGLKDFVAEYISEEALGDFGYLSEKGLIPLQEEARDEVRGHVSDVLR